MKLDTLLSHTVLINRVSECLNYFEEKVNPLKRNIDQSFDFKKTIDLSITEKDKLCNETKEVDAKQQKKEGFDIISEKKEDQQEESIKVIKTNF